MHPVRKSKKQSTKEIELKFYLKLTNLILFDLWSFKEQNIVPQNV